MEQEQLEKQELLPELEEGDKREQTPFKKSGLLAYFRELSIVIIGVLITLAITDMVADYNRQKELKGMLQLVKKELQENIVHIFQIERQWQGEQYAFRLIQQHYNDLEQIPADTLEKYRYVIGAIYRYDSKSDYYDALRNSLLVQHIKEKDLQPKLSEVYRYIYSLGEYLSEYSDQKRNVYFQLEERVDIQEMALILNGNVHDAFRYVMKENGFRRFIVKGETIVSPGYFDYCRESIQDMIRKMEQYGY